MSSKYDLKIDRELGKPQLPPPSAPLRDHRAAANALRILYPGIKIEGVSVRTLPDGQRVVRTIKM